MSPRRDHIALSVDRLVVFVDAVLAIALTLLVLPLVDLVPEAVRAHEPAVQLITTNLSSLGSFLLSFLVIARFWLLHHELFRFAETASRPLVWLNMLWLLAIVVLPFVTQLVGSYSSRGFVPQLYIGLLLAAATVTTAMVLEIRRVDAPRGRAWSRMLRGTLENLVLQVVAFGAVLVAPGLGYWPLVLLGLQDIVDGTVGRRVRRTGDEPPETTGTTG